MICRGRPIGRPALFRDRPLIAEYVVDYRVMVSWMRMSLQLGVCPEKALDAHVTSIRGLSRKGPKRPLRLATAGLYLRLASSF